MIDDPMMRTDFPLIYCAVCLRQVPHVISDHTAIWPGTYLAKCHNQTEKFRVSDTNYGKSITLFAVEALRRKATQIRRDHAVKRRAFLSAKRNGWKAK